jgi:hypothetical protein
MCDYSLLGVPNRLATEGEDLIVHRFNTGSIGLTEPQVRGSDICSVQQASNRAFWTTIKEWFSSKQPKQAVAVCIPPGASLLVHNMPEDIRQSFTAQPTELVTFTQLSVENAHRDAIRLRNGAEILLQRLREGQRVRVVKLSIPEEETIPVPSDSRRMTPSSDRHLG